MRQKILNHTSLLVILSVLLTFTAASAVMYNKYSYFMKAGIKNEAEYIRISLETFGEAFLTEDIGKATNSRITLMDIDGKVIFDSNGIPEDMTNHSDRTEMILAKEQGYGEAVRFSETFAQQTYYYAIQLNDGKILRVSQITDSVFQTLLSSFTIMGILLIIILIIEIFFVQKYTKSLMEPINQLNLEKPLEQVHYEELRPLLVRVDQQNKMIAKHLDELKAAEVMRQEFSANVSHELKTPLMSISGYAELLMNGMVDQKNVSVFSGRIYDEATRLSNLVADIIQLSKLDEKHVSFSFEVVDIYEIAEDVYKNLLHQAEKKDIDLIFEGSAVVVRGVRHIIYEMFFNLADNAIRYTPDGGEVQIQVGRNDKKIFYCVTDNGIGIPENEQGRIFERFYRVDKSHSRSTGGTGLGLSIVKHGAALHKAKINLQSKLGEGTSIQIIFSKSKSK